jgi:hypothetical protein
MVTVRKSSPSKTLSRVKRKVTFIVRVPWPASEVYSGSWSRRATARRQHIDELVVYPSPVPLADHCPEEYVAGTASLAPRAAALTGACSWVRGRHSCPSPAAPLPLRW